MAPPLYRTYLPLRTLLGTNYDTVDKIHIGFVTTTIIQIQMMAVNLLPQTCVRLLLSLEPSR